MIHLKILGDVQVILNGGVSQETLVSFDTQRLPFALGGAALINTDFPVLGETLIFDGVGYIFAQDQDHIRHSYLEAAFLMGIERCPQEPLQTRRKQSIIELYESLMQTYPKGFAIVGKALFSKLSVAYLKCSPIHGERINELQEKYWAREVHKNKEVDLFGVALRDPDSRAFYLNPNEKEISHLSSHTHVLIPDARHLLSDSELIQGEFWVEAIGTTEIVFS